MKKTLESQINSLPPRLLKLTENVLQVRMTGSYEALSAGEDIFNEAQDNGECVIHEESTYLDNKDSNRIKRKFMTVEMNSEKFIEDNSEE